MTKKLYLGTCPPGIYNLVGYSTVGVIAKDQDGNRYWLVLICSDGKASLRPTLTPNEDICSYMKVRPVKLEGLS